MSTRNDVSDDEEIISVFQESEDPVLTATEIADKLDMTRQGVKYRLDQLEDRGRVGRKKVGSRAVAWWLVAGV